MELGLQGKVAIVTGGSMGIGKATARELAREGADIVIVARRAPPLNHTAKELADETGRRVLPIAADARVTRDVERLVAKALATFGRIDILVNSGAPSGGGGGMSLRQTTPEFLMEEISPKVLGYFNCARLVAPVMQRQGWGRVINVGGVVARQSGAIAGGIRNAAISNLTKNLADQLGPYGITVNTVHPGYARTEASPASMGIETDENMIKRVIDAQDIAAVIAFLASPKAAAVTGQSIGVHGGTPLDESGL